MVCPRSLTVILMVFFGYTIAKEYFPGDYKKFVHPLTLKLEHPLVNPRDPNTSIFHLAIRYPVFHNFTVTIRLNPRRSLYLLQNSYNCYTIAPIPTICSAIFKNKETGVQHGKFFFSVEDGYYIYNETHVQPWDDRRWGFHMNKIIIIKGEAANYDKDYFLRLKLTRDGNVYANGQWIGTLLQNFAITMDPQFFDVFYTTIEGMAGVDLFFPLEAIVKSTKGADEYMARIMKKEEYLNKVNGKVGFKPPPVEKFQCVFIFIPCLLIGMVAGASSAGIYAYKVMTKAYAEAMENRLDNPLSPGYFSLPQSEEDSYFAVPGATTSSTDPKEKSNRKNTKKRKGRKSKGRKRRSGEEVKSSDEKITPATAPEIQATPTVLQSIQPGPPQNIQDEPENQYENLAGLQENYKKRTSYEP